MMKPEMNAKYQTWVARCDPGLHNAAHGVAHRCVGLCWCPIEMMCLMIFGSKNLEYRLFLFS